MAIRVVEVVLPNNTVALIQATDLDEDEYAPDGGQVAEKVGRRDALNLESVSGTLEGIAKAVRSGLAKVTPAKTTVELGLGLAVKSGKLTALVMEGGATASLKVTLEWVGVSDADESAQ